MDGYSLGTRSVDPGAVGTGSRPGPTSPPPAEGSGSSPTTIVPAMPIPPAPPWYRQKYAKTPGRSKVWLNAPPGSTFPESNDPSSAVAVWGLRPSLVHSTVAPTGTRIGSA